VKCREMWARNNKKRVRGGDPPIELRLQGYFSAEDPCIKVDNGPGGATLQNNGPPLYEGSKKAIVNRERKEGADALAERGGEITTLLWFYFMNAGLKKRWPTIRMGGAKNLLSKVG